MPVMAAAETSTVSEHNNNNRFMRKPPKIQQPISELDPIPPQTRSKPTISSILLSTFTPTADGGSAGAGGGGGSGSSVSVSTKKKFTSTTFRGLGCTASSQVSVPAAIRTSANWDGKKVRKKKQKKLAKGIVGSNHQGAMLNSNSTTDAAAAAASSSCLVVPDVWCGPGIGFATDAASVDCVVSRRPVPSSSASRPKVDSDRIHLRERASCTARRMVNPEEFSFFDTDPDTSHPRMDVFGPRHHRHSRHRSPEGLAEIVMLQSNLLMGGGRSFGLDRYRDWRLDVDSMSYEELLELGDKIGYVSTGLREDEIIRCLRKTKLSLLDGMSSQRSTQMQWKCSICQEEYEAEDDLGKLDCEHSFHINCIKQWLAHKKTCPICKTSALSQK